MESEADVPGRVHFLCNVCHVCKSGNPKVCCEICKMMYYCSAEHRRHNWRDHSQICRAVYKICQNQNLTFLYNEAVNLSGEGFKDLRQQTAMKCSEFLSRALDSWEYEFLYYPRVRSMRIFGKIIFVPITTDGSLAGGVVEPPISSLNLPVEYFCYGTTAQFQNVPLLKIFTKKTWRSLWLWILTFKSPTLMNKLS